MVDVAPSLAAVARAVDASQGHLLKQLTRVETHKTARIELDWVLAALQPSPEKTAWAPHRRPLGTVYVSTPATLPVYSFVLFAAAPAAVGNEVVLRPASASRDCAETVSELASEAELPVRLFSGPWQEFAAEARTHADGMVFCGSAEHARRLDDELPDQARLITQGPGVCAFVVTADADVDRAARDVVRTRLFNSCQDCMATERVYVAESVYSDFLAALLREVDRVRLGSNDDEDTDLSPLLLPGAGEEWYARLPELGTLQRDGQARGNGLYSMAVVEAAADSPVVLDEK